MKSPVKVWLALMSALVVVVLATSSRAAAQEFIYTANFADRTVSGFSFNPGNGRAKELPGSPFAAGTGPVGIAHSPDGRFLYVLLNDQVIDRPCGVSNGELLSYSINRKTGSLTLLEDHVLSGICSSAVTVDPSGKFVYAASFPPDGPKVGIIDGFQNSKGHLLPLAGSPFASPIEVPAGQNPAIHSLVITRNGAVMYASDPNNPAGILIVDRDTTTGGLTFRTAFNTGTDLGPLTMAPSGKFLLGMANLFFGAPGNGVYEFAIGKNGDLAPVPGSPFAGPNAGAGAAISISPNGRFVSSAVVAGIDMFRRHERAQLTAVAGSPFGSGLPAAVAFDTTGRFALIPGTVFRINQRTGSLAKVSEFPDGAGGIAIDVVPRHHERANRDGDKRTSD